MIRLLLLICILFSVTGCYEEGYRNSVQAKFPGSIVRAVPGSNGSNRGSRDRLVITKEGIYIVDSFNNVIAEDDYYLWISRKELDSVLDD